MTPRPADEARRALREARERGEGTGASASAETEAAPSVSASSESSVSPSQSPLSPSASAAGREDGPLRQPAEPTEPRPGDIARAALRNARSARQGEAHSPEGAPSDVPSVPPPDLSLSPSPSPGHGAGPEDPVRPQEPTDPGEWAGPARPARPASSAVPAGAEEPGGAADGSDDPAESAVPAAPDAASSPGSADRGGGRPADAAREALRAARRQAKVDAAREGPASTRRPSRPSGRQPRAGGAGTADARARAVRDFVSGAFRLPADWDADTDVEMDRDAGVEPAAEALPAGQPGSAEKRAGGSSAEDRTAPSREPGQEPESEGEPEPEPASEVEQGPRPEPHSEWERERASQPERQPDSTREPEAGEEGEEGQEEEPTWPSPRAVPATGAAPAQAPAQVPTHAPASPRPARATDPTDPSAPVTERPRHPEPASAARGRAASSSPPARPRAPRSMAAPGRDGELRRTFPALGPRTAADEGFAGTWWGNAWVTALEEGALDAARLERGRGYAERGHVDAITVTPGLVLAYVQGGRARPYRVQVRLRTLRDADWDRFLDAAVERPGHIAALLDKELPHSLADLADSGVPLLPGPGDLTPQCSCPDSGHPCKHAAALCYQTARLLDADPFVLLLLRGRGERELLDALSRRNAARAARAAQDRGPAPLPGVRAGEALSRRVLPPLPAPLPVPPHPEQPPAYPAAPGGPDPFALDQLATDAAARAHVLLATGRDPVGGLTLWQDAVRLAAARPGSGLTAGTRALYASLASAAGRDTAELARAVAAWRQGGPEGLDVLEEPWDPPAGRFDRARPLLLAADLPAFRPWRNRLTHPRGHVQLRLGRSGLWFAYESEPDREDWWPRGTPDLDPVGALTGLGTRVDL